MRITNSMLSKNYMSNLNASLTRLDKIQSQLATNRKFAHISDDPVAVIYSRQARYKLTRLSHYQKNVDTAKNWLTQAEAGLSELNEVIKSAYESAISAATDIMTPEDKANAAKYIGQLKDQVLQSLNTAFGDKYVYGGYNTTGYTEAGQNQPPFSVNAAGNLCYNGVDVTDPANLPIFTELTQDVMTFDVGVGSDVEVTVNGLELAFYGPTDPMTGVPKNIYNMINDLYETVNSGAGAEDINDYLTDLKGTQSHLLSLMAEFGGRTNRLEVLSNRYEQDEINYTQMKSDAEDADQAEVIMNYKMAESVYKAALSTGSYIIQPTLMDFLR
jgi:flagellar hook-associated protein 3 FlgL